ELFCLCLSHVAPLFEVATIAQSLATPCGVVIDSSGSLIISACTACCIYKIGPTAANTVLPEFLGVAALKMGLAQLRGLPILTATDISKSFLYIADQVNSRMRKMDLSTYSALFNYCYSPVYRLTTTGGVLYISDRLNNMIRKAVFSSSLVSTIATVPGGPCLLTQSKDGLRLFVSSNAAVIYQVYLPDGRHSYERPWINHGPMHLRQPCLRAKLV
ncbi:Hypothetical protein, putative, partial [Bodo saltans]